MGTGRKGITEDRLRRSEVMRMEGRVTSMDATFVTWRAGFARRITSSAAVVSRYERLGRATRDISTRMAIGPYALGAGPLRNIGL